MKDILIGVFGPVLIPAIIAITAVLFAKAIRESKENRIRREKEYRQRYLDHNYLEMELPVYHIAGHPYLQANTYIKFQIRKDKTIALTKGNPPRQETVSVITLDELISAEIKTESQIVNDGYIIAGGGIAFASPINSKVINSYLVLKYLDKSVEIACIFKNVWNDYEVGNILSHINRIRIEKANSFSSSQSQA